MYLAFEAIFLSFKINLRVHPHLSGFILYRTLHLSLRLSAAGHSAI